MIGVMIVDDHIVVRLGLRALIESQDDMRVVCDAANGSDATELLSRIQCDVVLLDLRMSGGGGLEALRGIRAIDPEVRVLMLSSFGSEEEIYQAVRAGASGYLLKDTGSDELLSAIQRVAEGGTWLPPTVAARYADRLQRQELTHREREILECVFRGLTNKEIAFELSVAENTVKNHINNLMFKLGAKDRTQATHLALMRGILTLD